MQAKNKANFQTILFGCLQLNRESQNELYKLYRPYGMSICLRYSENERQAKSVLNEGFMKVFQSLNIYDSNFPFKPWFRKIMINTALNDIKKSKKLRFETDLSEAEHLPVNENILTQISYRETLELVNNLSLAYRTVFNLYVIDGYTHPEIADILDIRPSTSRANLNRAKKRLQKLILAQSSAPL